MEPQNIVIDNILSTHQIGLGKHYNKYRNHVYRVFNYCLLLDASPANKKKYAIASAFHDLGIWTNHTFDYLEPSIRLAKDYLSKIGNKEWQDEISLMIDMHHKKSIYRGQFSQTVETFRKADWVDVSLGRKTFGLSTTSIKAIQKLFKNDGFTLFLILKGIKNFLRHPSNPLPMFKD
ncbi:MAG: HD domain-containing protein [Gracilimonas sp.]